MSQKRHHVTIEEYAILRNLESLTNSLLRIQTGNIRKSWLWHAIQEQLRQLQYLRIEGPTLISKGCLREEIKQ
jgi:hypothetical protein